MIRFALIITGIVISHIAYCQENFLSGYLFHLNGDTIKGFIDYREWEKNPDKIHFKKGKDSETLVYTPLDINGFSVQDEIYVSAVVKTEVSPSSLRELQYDAELQIVLDTTFLQTILEGEKSLYYYKSYAGEENFYIKQDEQFTLLVNKKYLKKQGEKNVVVENKSYIGQLKVYLDDCIPIQSKLNDIAYTQRSLRSLFQDYYKCSQSNIIFQKKRERISTEIGLLTGVSLSSIKFKSDRFVYLANANFSKSYSFTAGLFLQAIFPRNQRKWSIHNELLYTSYDLQGYYEDFKNENFYTITYTELGYSYVKINNLLRFTYPVKNIAFYANTGLSNGLSFNETNFKREVSKLYSIEKMKESKALDDTRRYEVGYVCGLGAIFKRYTLEMRYERGNGISEYATLGSSTIKYHFLLGYRF